MNIHQSMSLSTLAPDKPTAKPGLHTTRIKASKLIDGIFQKHPSMYASQSVDSYRKKWVSSRVFIRASVPTNKLATLKRANPNDVQRIMAGSNDVQVIADLNKSKTGIGSFIPKVIVLEGAAAVEAAHRKGQGRITVWLGKLAAEALDIMADDQISSDELYGLLNKALRDRGSKSRRPEKTARLENMMSPDPYLSDRPWIETVYPFENYFIYRDGEQTFRQSYNLNPVQRIVELSGQPTEVERKYADKEIAASTSIGKTIAMYACAGVQGCSCGCGGAKKLRATAKLGDEEDDMSACEDDMEEEE